MSVEEALSQRRSVREYTPDPVEMEQVAQLLWSAYGITSQDGFRTAPSALSLYPLEISLVAAKVSSLAPGFYRFHPGTHSLQLAVEGDLREELFSTTFNQSSVRHAAAVVVFSAVYERARVKLGDDARDYVHMDLGHSAENLHLQATALGLGTVVIAAFRRIEAARVLALPEDETPLYLMPVGHGISK